MAVERVTVLDSGPGFVRILSRDGRHCSGCAMKNGCGHRLLSATFNPHGDNSLSLPRPANLSSRLVSGDTLELAIDEGRLMGLSFLHYGFPVLCMVLATAIAGSLLPISITGEGWVISSALCGLAAGLILSRARTGRLGLQGLLAMRLSGQVSTHDPNVS